MYIPHEVQEAFSAFSSLKLFFGPQSLQEVLSTRHMETLVAYLKIFDYGNMLGTDEGG